MLLPLSPSLMPPPRCCPRLSVRWALLLLLVLCRSRPPVYLFPSQAASPLHRLLTSIVSLCPSTVCWLQATPSVRSEHRVSHAEVSLGQGGLSPGVSAAAESLRTRPRSLDVGSSRRQALLAAAATATALIDTASLPPAPSVAPVSTGFRHYGLPAPRSEGPTLPF